MSTVHANGIEIEYETFGAPDDPALLLVMGLGRQLVQWDEAFCEQLAAQGRYVIRYDNRDVGLSTKLNDFGVPNIPALWARRMIGLPVRSPYTLDDMADDGLGLLEALSIESADVVGVSLGGMVAQLMALRRPDRVRSLCSWMSTPGEAWYVPTWSASKVLMSRPPDDVEERLDYAVEVMKVLGSPPPHFDEAWIRDRTARALARDKSRAGVARQLAAVFAARPRTAALRRMTGIPTVVLHGNRDPLVPHAAGRATARAIAGARFVTFPGIGHDLPRGIWPQAIEAIMDNAARG